MGGMTPTDVANEALDAIGWPDVLGDLEDGSPPAQILLRKYRECLKQLLRSAHWNFARKQAPLTLLADASGNAASEYVGVVVPQPWLYEYAYPTDCAKMRFVPWSYPSPAAQIPAGNIQIPATPQNSAPLPQVIAPRQRPARFLEATDFNYQPPAGALSWDVQGVSPQGRTVILTNVPNAQGVYTAIMLYPSVWDALFRAAFVAYLAAEVALPIWAKSDRKFGLEVRGQQAQILQAKLSEARLVDGNEGTFSTDLRVDWLDARRNGGPNTLGYGGLGWGGGDAGVWGNGWDSLAVPGGSAF